MYEVIENGDYIGLRCPPESIEFFYVVEVLQKGIASKTIQTSSSKIFEGEPYIKVKYLERTCEGKNFVKFKNLPPVYINLGEVFATHIQMSQKQFTFVNINHYVNCFIKLLVHSFCFSSFI